MKPEEPHSKIPAHQTVMRLAFFWQARVTANALVAPKTPLSAKEMGQLKQLRNYLGDETINVIGWAVDNWWTFAQRARAEAGLESHPAKPHIGFLLAHYDTAVNLMAKKVPEQVAKLLAASAKRAEDWKRILDEEEESQRKKGLSQRSIGYCAA